MKTKKIIISTPEIKINLFNTNNFLRKPNRGGSLPNDININKNIIFEKLSNLSI